MLCKGSAEGCARFLLQDSMQLTQVMVLNSNCS
jgi:hypothetical protein